MNNRGSKSSLFLMELIMAVLIFTVAATICIQMFVRSHTLSEESVRLNYAVVWCESMAESFYATDGDMELLADSLNTIKTDDYHVELYFDDSYAAVSSEMDYRYSVSGVLSKYPETGLLSLKITCTDNVKGEEIYSLSPMLYPKNVGDSAYEAE